MCLCLLSNEKEFNSIVPLFEKFVCFGLLLRSLKFFFPTLDGHRKRQRGSPTKTEKELECQRRLREGNNENKNNEKAKGV